MTHVEAFAEALWHMLLELAPWLLVGLVAAGLIQALLPVAMVARWLGGRGIGAVTRAAVLGAPLPLCSCSVLPAAASLRRRGASRGATASFLVSTPETGVDSLAVSYALLGPFMMVARLVSAVASAIVVGLLVSLTPEPRGTRGNTEEAADPKPCCGGGSCCEETAKPQAVPWRERVVGGLRFAVTTLFDDLLVWLAVGVLAAAAVEAFVPEDFLAGLGSGLPAMLVMLAVGVPMYICATASTPLAAGLIAAGLSPGAALVFLLAGPATNVGTVGVVRRELGTAAAGAYMGGLAVAALAAGLATDWAVAAWGVEVLAQVAGEHEEVLPAWVTLPSVAAVLALSAWSVWRKSAARWGRRTAASCCGDTACDEGRGTLPIVR